MDYARFPNSYQNRRTKNKRIVRLFSVLVIFFVTGLIMISIKNSIFHPSDDITAKAVSPLSTPFPSPTTPPISSDLEQAVQDALQGTSGTYGIVIKNLKTGEYYGFNQNHVFSSGSLYKIWVMAVVYEQIQEGKFSLDTVLSKDLDDLAKEFNVTIDSSEPQTSGTLSMSVKDALYQMITISDNNAALLLTDKVRLSSISSFLKQNGFTQSHVGTDGDDPVTTSADVALLFEKIYKNQLIDNHHNQDMIDLLKQQRLNEKIPQNLPTGTIIAHKTGEIDDFTHDAGIVYSPNADYVIVVLTESSDTDAAIGRIANVSEAVYNYFNPQTPSS